MNAKLGLLALGLCAQSYAAPSLYVCSNEKQVVYAELAGTMITLFSDKGLYLGKGTLENSGEELKDGTPIYLARFPKNVTVIVSDNGEQSFLMMLFRGTADNRSDPFLCE